MSDTGLKRPTYLRGDVPSPFCADCGHAHCVRALDKALVDLDLDPSHVAIVSDVGCIGILDSLFSAPHTVHAIHGRAAAVGTGIELADSILHDSGLRTIVVVGDGGAMAALPYIVDAARMNVDMTVLVANNFLLGMSGGQSSGLSPQGFATTAMPEGSMLPALDLCAVVQQCGDAFVARTLATAEDLPQLVAEAIRHPGFALVEVVAICPEHTGGEGRVDERAVIDLLRRQNRPTGRLAQGGGRPDFGTVYGTTRPGAAEAPEAGILQAYRSPLHGTMRWVMAGTAGERVQWAGQVLMRAAVLSGLHATLRTTSAIMPGTGFVVTELCLSDDAIQFTGVVTPDVVVMTSHAGLDEVQANGTLSRASEHTLVCAEDSLPAFDGAAEIVRLPFRSMCTPRRSAVAGVLAAVMKRRTVPVEAVFDAIEQTNERASIYRDDAARLRAALQN